MLKQRRLLLANPKSSSWTTTGHAKDIASSPNPLYKEAVIESEARPAVVQLKRKAVSNLDWVHH